jgi:hypothetical protein
MAENWIRTLDTIAEDGLIDNVLYVDLCNEWPGDLWAPFFKNDQPQLTWTYWHTDKSMKYMKEAIRTIREKYPELPYCFSFTGGNPELYAQKDLSFFDLIEHHTWMAQLNDNEYGDLVGYNYERFSPQAYKNLVQNYQKVYLERPGHWRELLVSAIELVAASANKAGLPLITTECWGIVDFKDWPLLKWDIIKELGELGTITASKTGQWVAIATSNFAGPQFVGMWRDVDWHRRLTDRIRSGEINASLLKDEKATKLLKRM